MALTDLQRAVCRLLAEHCGKDPGFSPGAIVEQVARTGRFAAEEVEELAFAGPPPEAGVLARRWHDAVGLARDLVDVLPPEDAGTCVLLGDDLCRLAPRELTQALDREEIRFRSGSIGGALPTIRPS